ncbi:MAG TPA: sortase [Patescibacteria group bacterium]|nr:sortase [Patescibacteria group bacterium]
MNSSGIIYYFEWDYSPSGQPKEGVALKRSPKGPKALPRSKSWNTILGIGLLALSLGGLFAPMIPRLRLEAQFAFIQARTVSGNILASKGDALRSYFFKQQKKTVETSSAHTAPAVFNPLKQPDGSVIEPVDKEFGLIVPKIGVNAAVIPSVNPTKPGEYMTALENGIAHSSLSYFPNEDGTVYLFSHSTNYDWFVGDLNAVFYLLKNLEEGDTMVVMYKGAPYTYRLTEKRVVPSTAVSYLVPQAGARRLILQTCWPPGSVAERLLIFADLIEEPNQEI